ncbi:MAG: tryptophan--tRNA ligase [Lentisphaerae bacterium]|jgi:tryptophanyl-tRNA synthetase|nr:tryptophan--tRNA ligase [Lentisphaerota bacterium]MBT5607997.1 tryptophan--tRNA ligase [Lentisphaerota bacterium]MBT7057524.1 tryptophan--tRNA ligase [Lentisphaerota bacterium]MBT7845670.1 tryptophan--tRNA ligase [Lentisphaerota bacterium]
MSATKRVLSGIQPSGTLHLGNYFGMMKPAIELQEENECFYFIADYHALTQTPDPALLRERSLNVAIDFLACGLDPEKTTLFRQSDIPQVPALTWVLSCLTPVGLLERCHSYKDKVARGIAPNHGLFTYPVLMAADILMYGSHLVPVGKDQKQHLEVTRDLAIRFNNAYGETLVVPDAMIRDEVAVVPGIDGQKMSKSYDNTVEIFGPEKKIRKKIMKIVTDSTPMEEPKDPDTCNVFAIYKLMANEAEIAAMRERYTAGGMGYGHAKQALFEKYLETFAAFRQRRDELEQNLDEVEAILERGAERAREVAEGYLNAVKKATGLR